MKKIISLIIILSGYLFSQSPLPDNCHEINEIFTTSWNDIDDIDSPAYYSVNDTLKWLLATSKKTHDLVIYNACNGKFIQRAGKAGTEKGQFKRPNGICVIDSILLVVERDNHRIQVILLPSLKSIGFIGESQLLRPYGITCFQTEKSYELYVTDNYETKEGNTPPDSLLSHRIKHYRFSILNEKIEHQFIKNIGDITGDGVLRTVESIYADQDQNILLVSEEHTPESHLKVYDLEGNFTGKIIGKGLFKKEAEGIALWKTEKNKGYWIFTDQGKDINLFYVFDRISFQYLGAFYSKKTLNTDGVWLTNEKMKNFPQGAFFAIHDDGGVSAFSLTDIRSKLKLK